MDAPEEARARERRNGMKIDMSLVNWAAVAAAGIAAFMLGGLWYSALFGKLWIRLQGWNDQKVAEMKARMSPAKFLGGMVAAYTVLAFTVELLVVAIGLRGPVEGACLGSILWLGPAAAIGFTGYLASDRWFGGFGLDAAFQLIALVTQGVILASWR
jgi:hypothetical protein